VKQVEVSFVYL